jgi:hypothetical protein
VARLVYTAPGGGADGPSEAFLREESEGKTMGDKGKGNQTKVKKVKIPKMGNRPHEVRQRDGLKSMVPDQTK